MHSARCCAIWHRALDLRISAVLPALLGRISFDDDKLKLAREQALAPVLRMIEAAQAGGGCAQILRLATSARCWCDSAGRSQGTFPRDLDLTLAHRHLDLVLVGLRNHPPADVTPLSGPMLTLAQLRHVGASGNDGLSTD